MPITPTYPGVYIQEIPSGVRTINGVATSITAFIGRTLKGPANEPVTILSFGDFQRIFGGLWAESTLSYAVQHYFLNGGGQAIIVRVANGAGKATLSMPGTSGTLELEATGEGKWGNNLRAVVDDDTKDPTNLFNLLVEEVDPSDPSGNTLVNTETFRNLSVGAGHPRNVAKVLEQGSDLVRVDSNSTPNLPTPNPSPISAAGGSDGNPITDAEITGSETDKTGIWALDKADLFNLLCIPPLDPETDVSINTYENAATYCKRNRAMLLIDPPRNWKKVSSAVSGIGAFGTSNYAAMFFPRIKTADPLNENRLEEYAPCGAVAGVIARTDANRGVWKAPAGQEATLSGVRELTIKMTDDENGLLNPLGLNCLRGFPLIGPVIWGSRTKEGADRLASEWKYIPVRRLALFIEESLYRGLQWVVFEPNDEPLWAQIRLNAGAFMNNLFRQGAFQGQTPRNAYFVKCDKETTTQNDIDRGIVNIQIGFAPLKPAEFVIITIQQMAGQVQV